MLIPKEEFDTFVPRPPIPNAHKLTTLLYCQTRTQSRAHPCPGDCKVCGPFLQEVFYITVSRHPTRTAEWRLKNLADGLIDVWVNPHTEILDHRDEYGVSVRLIPSRICARNWANISRTKTSVWPQRLKKDLVIAMSSEDMRPIVPDVGHL